MKPWLKKMLFGCLGLVVVGIVTIGVVIWSLVSWLGTGYDNDGQQVVFRTFDNAIWRVVRREVEGADPKTFRAIPRSGGKYGLDGEKAFFTMYEIEGADVDTFEVLDWRKKFSRDKTHAYYGRLRVSDAPAGFQVLTQGYSKDDRHVYYLQHVVEGADPATFVVTSEVTSLAKDQHGSYSGRKRIKEPQK